MQIGYIILYALYKWDLFVFVKKYIIKTNFEKDSTTRYWWFWNFTILIHNLFTFVTHFQNLEIFAVHCKVDQKTLNKSARQSA